MIKQVEVFMPTKWGNFKMIAYAKSGDDSQPHIAMVHENFDKNSTVLLRIHSECLTGDLFGSNRCDCGEQLDKSLRQAALEGGIVIYLRQEGRGIGIINKLKAYNLQDKGFNTAEANVELGHDVDSRNYDEAIEILKDLGVKSVRLLTNNPLKIKAVEDSPIVLHERVPLIIRAKRENEAYLKTKKEFMGHLFNGKL